MLSNLLTAYEAYILVYLSDSHMSIMISYHAQMMSYLKMSAILDFNNFSETQFQNLFEKNQKI